MAETEKKELNGAGDAEKAAKVLENKIIRQIEYYFGDHNLRHDKFLKEVIKEDEGWVPLETLLKFNRLKSLSTDKSVILEAIKKSPNQLLEISDDTLKLRRSPTKPLPEETEDQKTINETRSVYVKGFPLDSTLDDILEFFEDQGEVENVYMRRFLQDKKFKGSVWALFKSAEGADKFMNEKDVSFKDKPLTRETCKKYRERKAKQYKKGKNKQDNAAANSETNDDKGTEEAPEEMKKGCILHLVGFKDNVSREDIKECFDNYAKVAWVDFSRGDTEAWVRFHEEGTAKIGLEKAKEENEGKIQIKESEVTADILEGNDEIKFWLKTKQEMQTKRDRKYQRGGRGGNNRGKGRGRRQRGTIKRFDESNEKKETSKKTCDDQEEMEIAEEKPVKKDEPVKEESKKDEQEEQSQKRKREDDTGSEPPAKVAATEV